MTSKRQTQVVDVRADKGFTSGRESNEILRSLRKELMQQKCPMLLNT